MKIRKKDYGEPRDSQRGKVYAAEKEWEANNKGKFPKMIERFDKLEDLQKLVDKIVATSWWKKYDAPDMGEKNDVNLMNPRQVEVDPGRGCRNALAFRMEAKIKMPIWSRKRWVVLHELAHLLQSQRPGHGRNFCRVYLDIVSRFVGTEAAKELKACFKKHKVKYSKKRKGGNRKGNPEALRKWREQQKVAKQK